MPPSMNITVWPRLARLDLDTNCLTLLKSLKAFEKVYLKKNLQTTTVKPV